MIPTPDRAELRHCRCAGADAGVSLSDAPYDAAVSVKPVGCACHFGEDKESDGGGGDCSLDHQCPEATPNCTGYVYDIKWGKPDQTSLLCDASGTGAGWPALPTCVNTSFGGYAGNWTMATKLHPGPTVGLSHTTPALMSATLTPPSRGTTAWRPAAEEP